MILKQSATVDMEHTASASFDSVQHARGQLYRDVYGKLGEYLAKSGMPAGKVQFYFYEEVYDDYARRAKVLTVAVRIDNITSEPPEPYKRRMEARHVMNAQGDIVATVREVPQFPAAFLEAIKPLPKPPEPKEIPTLDL